MPMNRPVQEDIGRAETALLWTPPMGTVGIMGGLQFMHTPFVQSLLEMAEFNSRHLCQQGQIMYEWAPMTWFPAARNWLAEHASGDWLFFCDCDHTFEPDLLAQMLPVLYTGKIDGRPIEVVSCTYFQRHPPHRPLAYKWTDNGPGGHGTFLICDTLEFDAKYDAVRVAAAGTGGMLIKMSVFERIRDELHEAPFDIVPIAEDIALGADGEYRVQHGPALSEDLSFCMRLKRLDIPIVLLTQLYMDHLVTGCVGRAAHDAAIRGMTRVTEKTTHEGNVEEPATTTTG